MTAALAAPLPGCKRAPPPDPAPAIAPAPVSTSFVQSVRKLDGAPTHIAGMKFASDGASVLVLEARYPKQEGEGQRATYAISRQPTAGGAAKDLLASDELVLEFAPLGDSVVALKRPSLASIADGNDGPLSYDERAIADEKTALYRVSDSGEPTRISPEGRRCTGLAGSEGGQWVAFSIAAVGENRREVFMTRDTMKEEIHVLGAKPGEEITLAMRGRVRDLSPDGARLLVWLPPPETKADAGALTFERFRELSRTRRPNNKANSVVVVTVKGEAVTAVPTSLKVDGVDVAVGDFWASLEGDGLLFRGAHGETYRSDLDGSNAAHLFGPRANAESLAFTGAPEDAGAPEVAGAPAPEPRRFLSPKGDPYELREEAGAVVLSALEKGKPAGDPIAKFDGPLSGIGIVALDASEKRLAIAVSSDSSRNGRIEMLYDDAQVFLTDPAPGSLSFGRAPVASLADEIKPKIAAAAGIPASSVTTEPEDGSLKAIAELPWIAGEKAKDLLRRAFVAARAITAVVPEKDVVIVLRIGPLDLTVSPKESGNGQPYNVLVGSGVATTDPEALTLVVQNPVNSSFFTTSNETFSGALENTGNEPTLPIEVFAVVARSSSGKRTEVVKKLGSIAPGKKARYELIISDLAYGAKPRVRFRAGGERVDVFNQYSYDHCVDWLDTALAIYAAHGLWSEEATGSREGATWLVKLTPERAALPDAERAALIRTITKMVDGHRSRFHRNGYELFSVMFKAPDGSGWRLEEGKKIERVERPKPEAATL